MTADSAPATAPLTSADSVGYLGPMGTFTEVAMRSMESTGDAQPVPLATVDAVLDAVRSGEVAAGVVPIENSLEGPVTTTLDALARDDSPLVITEEWALPVKFALLVRPGVALGDIHQVASIPIAAAQCRNWLTENIPNAHVLAALSTASAAQRLGTEDPPPYDAAISPAVAAEHYGLEVLVDGIGDNVDASTRFVQVGARSAANAERRRRRRSCYSCVKIIPAHCWRFSRSSRCAASTSPGSNRGPRVNSSGTTTSRWTARVTLTMLELVRRSLGCAASAPTCVTSGRIHATMASSPCARRNDRRGLRRSLQLAPTSPRR